MTKGPKAGITQTGQPQVMGPAPLTITQERKQKNALKSQVGCLGVVEQGHRCEGSCWPCQSPLRWSAPAALTNNSQNRATPDPNSAGKLPHFFEGKCALVRAFRVRGSHWAAARECEEHHPSQTLHQHGQSSSVLLSGSTQAPLSAGRTREMSQLTRHRTQISLHIHLLLSTHLLHLPLALKSEVNTHLITFFRKVGISGNLCRQRSSEQSGGTSGDFLQRTELSRAARQLPTAAHPSTERGTARHPMSHCHSESLPRVLNRRCRQLGNSLKLHPACQPVFCRTSQPKCL